MWYWRENGPVIHSFTIGREWYNMWSGKTLFFSSLDYNSTARAFFSILDKKTNTNKYKALNIKREKKKCARKNWEESAMRVENGFSVSCSYKIIYVEKCKKLGTTKKKNTMKKKKRPLARVDIKEGWLVFE